MRHLPDLPAPPGPECSETAAGSGAPARPTVIVASLAAIVAVAVLAVPSAAAAAAAASPVAAAEAADSTSADSARAGGTAPPAPDSAAVDELAREHLDAAGVSGLTVTVVREGEVVHAEGYGHNPDGADVTGATPVPVASLSKSMTAASILRLAEEGELSLDDPVRDHLPGYRPVDDRAERITVRQLLDQTSGLGSYGLVSPDRQRIGSKEEALEVLSGMELTSDPGERHTYFGGNYWLAAALAEEVTGLERGDQMDENVFGPLGMDDTGTAQDPDRAGPGGAASGYGGLLGTGIARGGFGDYSAGTGDVVTTAEDLGRFLAPFTSGGLAADGTRFLGEESVDAALTASAPEGVYALGWRERSDPDDGPPRVTHDGAGFNHLAHQGIHLERGYAVAVTANTMLLLDPTFTLAMAVMDLVTGEEPPPPGRNNLWVDLGVSALLLLSVGLGVRRWTTASEWAERVRERGSLRAALGLVPRLLPLALVLGFALVIALNGAHPRSLMLWFMWPMLGLWGLVATLSQTSTVLVRLHRLRRSAPGSGSRPAAGPGAVTSPGGTTGSTAPR
ncbi:serine hydrolase domain-containing protein [Nocardiopsis ganjiahuensis]|uniref:serine hydrolase domain-containing protein n=1 Tax=Nocardiopsis ganjiahuensis TaxID=239984 RepID=UPI000367DB4C|nr:serine hydrolase domain-containing protein [Nocardiopsis ganjiahuensis]